jgi:hypothetical protein
VSAPARLMRGAVCERIVLERGSILSGGGPAVLVQVTDLRVGENGEIYADLARQGTPGVRAARGPLASAAAGGHRQHRTVSATAPGAGDKRGRDT